MKYSIIIPVAKKDTRFLKRCLMSLIDQDYQNWEAIVVFDGFQGECKVVDERISSYSLEARCGAAKVRNFGASKASGELLFFLDADCEVCSGMLTLMIEKLQDNVDCSFIYGAYRMNNTSIGVYYSRPFDEYVLESMNYISTMSPMYRDVFDNIGGFDDELEFFQDWDFWLRATKYGYRGHYIKDVIFRTEMPNNTSISGNKKYSMREKILAVEKKNGIQKRDVCVTTLSCPYQALERAKILNAKYAGMHQDSNLIQSPAQLGLGCTYELMQGFFPLAIEDHVGMFSKDAIKIVNFIGTDVWQLRNKFSWESLNIIKRKYLDNIDVILCNSDQLRDELSEIGIQAKVVYQPIRTDILVTPLPEEPVVSAYFSKGHPMHNENMLIDLAKSMPDIKFLFFGTNLSNQEDKNITYRSFIDIQRAINESTMHIRLTNHDGFPHTPIHFMLGGRRVLSNFRLKYADYVDVRPNLDNWAIEKPKIIEMIRSKLNTPIDHKVDAVRQHYKQLGDYDKYRKQMELIFKQARKKGAKDENIVRFTNVQ